MSVLYIMPTSMRKIRFVGLAVWSPIGNIQTDRLYFIDVEDYTMCGVETPRTGAVTNQSNADNRFSF